MEPDKRESAKKNFKSRSKAVENFTVSFKKEKEVEEKIAVGLEFMKIVLSDAQDGSLKDFWDVKKLIGPLFKEPMNSVKRNHLWNQYAELGDEAHRLKEIKDEQAAFSIEQVELAIEAVEKDISRYDHLVEQMPHFNFPKDLENFSLNEEKYGCFQKELQFLKTLISRLDSLRKEILSIDMRISHKNKILKRLSKLGDEVFPKRKELIKKVSEFFISDIESFAQQRFPKGEGECGVPYYVIRNEIKSFQGLAKLLTLNTQSFAKTRKVLSECWDKIKEKDKERRAKMGERFEEQKKNYETLLLQVEAFEIFCSREENQERNKILEKSDGVYQEVNKTPLNREQVKILKDRIQKAQHAVFDKVQGKVREKKSIAKKAINEVRERLEQLIKNENSISLEDLEKEESILKKDYRKLNLSQMEIHRFERTFADLRSFIFDKKEGVIGVEQLEDLYKDRGAHLEVIKRQMEEYRKEMGGSSLDFEKAMAYRELYDSAKIHFNSEVEALENLEEKLI